MRVSRTQIVKGVSDYIQSDVLPKMADERAIQIIMSIAVNAVAANNKVVDSLFAHDVIRTMLDDDGSGTYEIAGVADAMRKAIDQYGSFPVNIPAIPLVSPHEITLRLNADDIEAMRHMIESAM